MKKFLVILLCICLVCGIESPSMAAKKRAKKSKAQQGDKIEQILRRYKVANSPINANTIRRILKQSGNDLILVVTSGSTDDDDMDNITYWKLISARTGAEQSGVVERVQSLFFYEVVDAHESGACMVTFYPPGSTLVFYDAQGYYLSSYTDKKCFAGLAKALAKSYKYDKNPNPNYRDTALLPFFWGAD